jgi:hypothetical protein
MAAAASVIAIIRVGEELAPVVIPAIQALINKMKGMTPEQIAQLTKSVNDATIATIDAELAKLPPPQPPSGS